MHITSANMSQPPTYDVIHLTLIGVINMITGCLIAIVGMYPMILYDESFVVGGIKIGGGLCCFFMGLTCICVSDVKLQCDRAFIAAILLKVVLPLVAGAVLLVMSSISLSRVTVTTDSEPAEVGADESEDHDN
ncbi:uncharacterized protein LOC144439647 [Glandiceps talaboti]